MADTLAAQCFGPNAVVTECALGALFGGVTCGQPCRFSHVRGRDERFPSRDTHIVWVPHVVAVWWPPPCGRTNTRLHIPCHRASCYSTTCYVYIHARNYRILHDLLHFAMEGVWPRTAGVKGAANAQDKPRSSKNSILATSGSCPGLDKDEMQLTHRWGYCALHCDLIYFAPCRNPLLLCLRSLKGATRNCGIAVQGRECGWQRGFMRVEQ